MVCAADPAWAEGLGLELTAARGLIYAVDCGVSPLPGIPVCTARAALHPGLLQVNVFLGACGFGH